MKSVSSFSSIEDTATTFHIASYAYVQMYKECRGAP